MREASEHQDNGDMLQGLGAERPSLPNIGVVLLKIALVHRKWSKTKLALLVHHLSGTTMVHGEFTRTQRDLWNFGGFGGAFLRGYHWKILRK